jgi:hypothetical protein
VTGVHVVDKPKPKCRGCCIMLKHISLSDVVISRVFVSFCSGFRFAIGFCLVVVRVVGFDPWRGLARPGPARAPLAPPALPMRAPA